MSLWNTSVELNVLYRDNSQDQGGEDGMAKANDFNVMTKTCHLFQNTRVNTRQSFITNMSCKSHVMQVIYLSFVNIQRYKG